jgi:hypothetical protein
MPYFGRFFRFDDGDDVQECGMNGCGGEEDSPVIVRAHVAFVAFFPVGTGSTAGAFFVMLVLDLPWRNDKADEYSSSGTFISGSTASDKL